MKTIKHIGVIGLCCLSGMAAAQRWEPLGGKNSSIELDRSSVVTVDGGFQAWSRLTQPQRVLGPEEGFFYRRLLQLNEYHCADRTYSPLQRMYFNDAGLLVKDQRFPDPDTIERIVPGSVEDRLYRAVCRNFKPRNPGSAQGTAKTAARSAEDRVKTATRDRNALLATEPTATPKNRSAVAPQTRRQTVSQATQRGGETTQSPGPASSIAASQGNRAASSASSKTLAPTPPGSSSSRGGGGGISGFLSKVMPTRPPVSVKDIPAVSSKPAAAQAPSKPTHEPVKNPETKPEPKGKPGTVATAQSSPGGDTARRPTGNLPWLYDTESAKGPQKWGSLSSANALCDRGLLQSPIDIRGAIVTEMSPVRFEYRPVPLKIIDTGNTIRVNVDPGASLVWQGTRYDLLYYTFHNPSEIQIDGKAYDMAIHFVHRSVQGKLTVLAVPVRIGAANAVVQRLWNNLPLEVGVQVAPQNVVANPSDLLPKQKGYYVFVGSLSTPPCTEGVLWLVMKTPVEISQGQFEDFTHIYRHNVRPIKPTRGRLIKVTRF